METQEGRNSSIICAASAKLHQIRVNMSLCCWVGNPVGGKQEIASKDKQISTMINRVDRWNDKQHGQSDWILGKGGDRICGSTGELCNPMKLPRALRTRFARP